MQTTFHETVYQLKEAVRRFSAANDRRRLGLDANGHDRRGTLEERVARAKARRDSEVIVQEGAPGVTRIVRHI